MEAWTSTWYNLTNMWTKDQVAGLQIEKQMSDENAQDALADMVEYVLAG